MLAADAWGWVRRQAADPEGQVLLALAGLVTLTVGWVCFWPVPTEVVGRGVMIVPGGAKVIDARAGCDESMSAPAGTAWPMAGGIR